MPEEDKNPENEKPEFHEGKEAQDRFAEGMKKLLAARPVDLSEALGDSLDHKKQDENHRQ